MTEQTIRLQALRQLIALIDADAEENLGGIQQVVAYDPGKTIKREAIYTIDVDGDVEPSALAGHTDTPTDDNLTVTLVARASKVGQKADGALDRVDLMYQCIRNVVLGEEYGGDLDGLDGISSTALGNVIGPVCGPEDDTTWVGLYQVDVLIITDEVSA